MTKEVLAYFWGMLGVFGFGLTLPATKAAAIYNKDKKRVLTRVLMMLQELQYLVLQLPISDRWRLLKTVLTSIQQETMLL